MIALSAKKCQVLLKTIRYIYKSAVFIGRNIRIKEIRIIKANKLKVQQNYQRPIFIPVLHYMITLKDLNQKSKTHNKYNQLNKNSKSLLILNGKGRIIKVDKNQQIKNQNPRRKDNHEPKKVYHRH